MHQADMVKVGGGGALYYHLCNAFLESFAGGGNWELWGLISEVLGGLIRNLQDLIKSRMFEC